MKKLVAVLALLALVPFALAACGGDDEAPPPPPPEAEEPAEEPEANGAAETLDVTADPDGDLAYEEDSLTAEAGEVRIDLDNPSTVPHDVSVEDTDGNDVGGTEVITNDSASATLDLEPGEYTFYCSVPGHREAGMEGPLTVE